MNHRWIVHVLGLGMLIMPVAPVFADVAKDELGSRLTKLEQTLSNRGLLDLLQQVEALKQEVQGLHGQLENQTQMIEQLRKTQRDSYMDLDQRLQGLERYPQGTAATQLPPGGALEPPLPTLDPAASSNVAGMPAPDSALQLEVQSPVAPSVTPGISDAGTAGEEVAGVAPPGMAIAGPAPPAPSIAPRGPTVDDEASEAGYSDAFSLLKAGQYDESIAAFNEFLKQYPGSQYADNAQYWLGEAYYVMRQFEAAAAEYQKLIQNYPESNKQSHAMLKIGYCFYELGLLDQARAVLEDLRARYPGSTAARLADERIQRIHVENSP